jgi:hypothetical protein
MNRLTNRYHFALGEVEHYERTGSYLSVRGDKFLGQQRAALYGLAGSPPKGT